MTARTVAVRRALVQAGERGLLHVASQQNTGTWIAVCGRQVRGRDVRVWDGAAAPAHAEAHPEAMCPDCADLALAVAAAVERAA